MAPGGVTYAFQESCAAFRVLQCWRFHRSSAQFIRQSEHYNKWCDTDTSGGRRAITAAAAYSEKRVVDSRRRAAKPPKSVPIWNSRRNLAWPFAPRFAGKACLRILNSGLTC